MNTIYWPQTEWLRCFQIVLNKIYLLVSQGFIRKLRSMPVSLCYVLPYCMRINDPSRYVGRIISNSYLFTYQQHSKHIAQLPHCIIYLFQTQITPKKNYPWEFFAWLDCISLVIINLIILRHTCLFSSESYHRMQLF